MAKHRVFLEEQEVVIGKNRVIRHRPKGRLQEHRVEAAQSERGEALWHRRVAKEEEEDVTRLGSGGLAARLFVGLKVGDEKTLRVEDVVDKVIEIRREQDEPPDATILSQRGVYSDSKGRIIDEPSVQIIILDLAGMKKKQFIEEMSELASRLAVELEQETIILEIQKKGVVSDVFAIT